MTSCKGKEGKGRLVFRIKQLSSFSASQKRKPFLMEDEKNKRIKTFNDIEPSDVNNMLKKCVEDLDMNGFITVYKRYSAYSSYFLTEYVVMFMIVYQLVQITPDDVKKEFRNPTNDRKRHKDLGHAFEYVVEDTLRVKGNFLIGKFPSKPKYSTLLTWLENPNLVYSSLTSDLRNSLDKGKILYFPEPIPEHSPDGLIVFCTNTRDIIVLHLEMKFTGSKALRPQQGTSTTGYPGDILELYCCTERQRTMCFMLEELCTLEVKEQQTWINSITKTLCDTAFSVFNFKTSRRIKFDSKHTFFDTNKVHATIIGETKVFEFLKNKFQKHTYSYPKVMSSYEQLNLNLWKAESMLKTKKIVEDELSSISGDLETQFYKSGINDTAVQKRTIKIKSSLRKIRRSKGKDDTMFQALICQYKHFNKSYEEYLKLQNNIESELGNEFDLAFISQLRIKYQKYFQLEDKVMNLLEKLESDTCVISK